jgi:signal transduction histidine kinase
VLNNRFLSKTGDYYWISWSSIAHDSQGYFYSAGQNITEQKKLEEELLRVQAENKRKITAAIIQTEEKERAQIGKELHDHVNQVLTTVKLYMELFRDTEHQTNETLQKAVRLQQEAIDEIRNISKHLSLPALGEIELKESVEELVDNIAQTHKVAIEFESHKINERRISKEVQLAVYRILQEHLTNILKHAEAFWVKVLMEIEDNALVVEVRDNGKGFNPEKKTKGLGMINMKSRAECVHGTFDIRSAPGKGCILSLHLPLKTAK